MYSENDYIMWLNAVQNISTDIKYNLIDYFGTANEVYNANKTDLKDSGILSDRDIHNIISCKNRFNIDDELNKLDHSPIKYYTYLDKEFPKQLMQMQNPPLGLYVWGELPESHYPYVSIVGTRKASEYGCIVCRKLANELAQAGIVIVSGMAYGIDSEAHRACIEAGGKTIAVLGNGADICYPAANRSLRNNIIDNGCIVSEFPLGTPSTRYNFPYRNRIIACMSSLVIVVEGEIKSGTLITAGHALDNGRTVMAVPGNITSRLSEAPNRLVADGCAPVLSVEDILDELNVRLTQNSKVSKKLPDVSDEEKVIFDLILYEPVTIDELCIKSDMSIDFVNSILMMLELKGCIMKLSGQKYVRSI